DTLDLDFGNVDAAAQGQGIAAPGYIEDGKFRVGLLAPEDVGDEAGDVIHVHKLELVLKVATARRQPQRQTLALAAQAFGQASFAAGNAAQHAELVILHSSSCINMRAQNIGLAFHSANARLHSAVGLLLLQGIRQALGVERRVFRDRLGEIGAVHQRAAGEDEIVDPAQHAVVLGDGLSDAAGAGYVDQPHVFLVDHARAQGIKHEGQVRHGLRAIFAHELQELVAGAFFGKVDLLKARERHGIDRIANVGADYGEVW